MRAQTERSDFDALVLSQVRTIRGIGIGLLRYRDELDDFTQEVILRVYANRDRLRELSRLPQWVHAIARNVAHTWNRKTGAFSGEAVPELVDVRPSPASVVEEAERWRAFVAALHRLNPADQALLYSYYVEEESYATLRERYGLSYTALSTRLYRAREQLRRLYGALLGVMVAVGLFRPRRRLTQIGDRIMATVDKHPSAVSASLAVALHVALGLGLGGIVYHAASTETHEAAGVAPEFPVALVRIAATPSPQGPSLRQLVWPPEVHDPYSMSPDGTKIAFVNYAMGQNIGVYDYTSKQVTWMTHFTKGNQEAYPNFPIWSPDGKQVAFLQVETATNIAEVRISTLEGPSRVVYRNEDNPGATVVPTDWLTDGSAIVAVLQRADKTHTLGLIPTSGGMFKSLYSLHSLQDGGLRGQDASPDGRFIVFADGPPGSGDIYTIATDGQSLTVLSDHPADDSQPRWSPDSRHIVFMSRRQDGNPALWGVAVENGQPIGEPFLIKGGMMMDSLFNWAAPGLVYWAGNWRNSIFITSIDLATGNATGKPRQASLGTRPIWSPDGRYLAYLSGEGPGAGRKVMLYSLKDEKTWEFPLPADKISEAYALMDFDWLPDGSGVSFPGQDTKGQLVLFRLTLAAGEWTALPLPHVGLSTWTPIAWTRDGHGYLYVADNWTDRARIIERNMENGSERVLYPSEPEAPGAESRAYGGLSFSPDAKWLAINQREQGQEGYREFTVLLNLETGKMQPGPKGRPSMSWAPDGQYLVLGGYNEEKGAMEFQMISRTGGPSKQLSIDLKEGLPEGHTQFRGHGWSPDGKQLAFGLGTWKATLYIMENVISQGTSASR